MILKNTKLYFDILVIGTIFYFLYHKIGFISQFAVYEIFKMPVDSRISECFDFFLYNFPKMLILLTVIIFIVGIIRSFFTVEKTRKYLKGKNEFFGIILAALLGIVTPFCTCSAIPLFIGFVEAGIPLNITFTFLIASPMINEVALIMLYGMFSLNAALLYLFTGLFIAVTSGFIIGRLKLEKYVEPWVYEVKMGEGAGEEKLKFEDRIIFGKNAVYEILRKVCLYIAIGIVFGSVIHGLVPYAPADPGDNEVLRYFCDCGEHTVLKTPITVDNKVVSDNFIKKYFGRESKTGVILAVLAGAPIYSNAAGVAPLVKVFIEKGAAFGTALAFMMAVVGLSLPEIIILRKILKWQLIAIFVSVTAAGITIVGYIFNLLI